MENKDHFVDRFAVMTTAYKTRPDSLPASPTKVALRTGETLSGVSTPEGHGTEVLVSIPLNLATLDHFLVKVGMGEHALNSIFHTLFHFATQIKISELSVRI